MTQLIRHVLDVFRSRGSATALVDEQESVTFAELAERVSRVAEALVDRGLTGCRVALLAPQSAAWVEGYLGILMAGATAVPLSPLHPPSERAWFVQASRASAVLAAAPFMRAATQCAGDVPVLDVRGAGSRSTATVVDGCTEDSIALMLYTSGTTGKPKGVMLTHGNVQAIISLLATAWEWAETDRLVHTLPLHHMHGICVALLVSVLGGGETRLLQRFDAAKVWDAIDGATVLMGVPTQHKLLLDHLDAAEASERARHQAAAARLRLVTSGSAALPVTIGERWRALAGQYPLERYGMTEVGIVVSNPVRGERLPGSIGRPLAGTEIRLVTDGGRDAAVGEPGEIWIRGPSVFRGYDGDEAATEAAFTDGWFRSGDTATWRADGGIRILGRTSVDIIKSGGYKLSALEIEEVLRGHPDISEVAVVGLPDDTWGECVVAAVVPVAGVNAPDEALLRAWAKERLAAYKVPRRFAFVARLPTNALGKVVKPELARTLANPG